MGIKSRDNGIHLFRSSHQDGFKGICAQGAARASSDVSPGHCRERAGVPASRVIAFQNHINAYEMMCRLRKYYELCGHWPDLDATMFKELSEINSVHGPLRAVSPDVTIETADFQTLRDRILCNAQALD
jgi:hypothetical protein